MFTWVINTPHSEVSILVPPTDVQTIILEYTDTPDILVQIDNCLFHHLYQTKQLFFVSSPREFNISVDPPTTKTFGETAVHSTSN